MNIARYHIAGGDYPKHNHILRKDAQIPTYKTSKEAEYNWEAYSPKQEGCHFSTGKMQDKVYQAVYKELVKQGLNDEIALTGVDETSIDMSIDEIKALSYS